MCANEILGGLRGYRTRPYILRERVELFALGQSSPTDFAWWTNFDYDYVVQP
jgi:hypothetical protein